VTNLFVPKKVAREVMRFYDGGSLRRFSESSLILSSAAGMPVKYLHPHDIWGGRRTLLQCF